MTRKQRIGIITDIHIVPDGTPNSRWHNEQRFDIAPDLLERGMRELVAREIDLLAVLGDLTHFADAESIQRCIRGIEAFDGPVVMVRGNHDDLAGPGRWEAMVDAAAPDHFVIAGVRGSATEHAAKLPKQSFDLLGWHPFDAQPLTITVSHYPLLDQQAAIEGRGFKYAPSPKPEGIDQLAGLDHPIVALHGHLHLRYTVTQGALLQIGFASLIEAPHSVAIVDVLEEDGGVRVEVQHIDVASHNVEVLPVLSPPTQQWQFRDGGWSELGNRGLGEGLRESV